MFSQLWFLSLLRGPPHCLQVFGFLVFGLRFEGLEVEVELELFEPLGEAVPVPRSLSPTCLTGTLHR